MRRLLRGMLRWDSWAYRCGSGLLNFLALLKSEGFGTAWQVMRLRGAALGGAAQPLRFARLAHPFYIRPGTKDVAVAVNNFVREEYGAVSSSIEPRVLVDGGAYIGDTSAYFLSRYPGLRIIALEPMEDSYQMARLNLAPYGRQVELLQMALTANGEFVRMSGIQTGARASHDGEIEVRSITIPQILDRLHEGRIDILKLDIEGAEGPLFADNPESWISRVGMIIVETHGPSITQSVLAALERNGWIAERVRNLYFCRPAS